MKKIIIIMVCVAILISSMPLNVLAEYLKLEIDKQFIDNFKYIIRDDRTLVHTRDIAQYLGLEIEWIKQDREVKIYDKYTSIIITFKPGDREMIVNRPNEETEKYYNMDTNCLIENNKTYVPIKYVVEALGGYVVYYSDTDTISVYTPAYLNKSKFYSPQGGVLADPNLTTISPIEKLLCIIYFNYDDTKKLMDIVDNPNLATKLQDWGIKQGVKTAVKTSATQTIKHMLSLGKSGVKSVNIWTAVTANLLSDSFLTDRQSLSFRCSEVAPRGFLKIKVYAQNNTLLNSVDYRYEYDTWYYDINGFDTDELNEVSATYFEGFHSDEVKNLLMMHIEDTISQNNNTSNEVTDTSSASLEPNTGVIDDEIVTYPDTSTSVPTSPSKKTPEVITLEYTDLKSNFVTLHGKVLNSGSSEIIKYGFSIVDTTTNESWEIPLSVSVTGALTSNGEFSYLWHHTIKPEHNYCVTAYAENSKYYSASDNYVTIRVP